MSELKEQQMKEWLSAVDIILSHIESEDDVLRARARIINNLLKNTIQEWLNCDEAHTKYTNGPDSRTGIWVTS